MAVERKSRNKGKAPWVARRFHNRFAARTPTMDAIIEGMMIGVNSIFNMSF
jgi:hypothetical protein